jgi:hypothetical protein
MQEEMDVRILTGDKQQNSQRDMALTHNIIKHQSTNIN